MGEEIALERAGVVSVRARARSIVPMEKLVVLRNGQAVATVPGPARELTFSDEVEVDESSWIAVQAEGGSSKLVTDTYLFAHSTPVWVSVSRKPVLVERDRDYLERYVEALIEIVRTETGFRNEGELEMAIRGFTEARDRIRGLRSR
jgi:hypothetical protein